MPLLDYMRRRQKIAPGRQRPQFVRRHLPLSLEQLEDRIVPAGIDLRLVDATAPAIIKLGDTVPVSWNIQNQGSDDAAPSWYDAVYLSQDATFSANDTALIYNFQSSTVTAGGSYTTTQNASIPVDGNAGSNYLLS